MTDNSTTPYFVRALHEWCTDNGLTPQVVVRVNDMTQVPEAYIKNGEITLNISYDATRHLKISNDLIQFSARFAGISHEIAIPFSAVIGFFAKESGQGMAFENHDPKDKHPSNLSKPRGTKERPTKKRRLQLVK